MNPTLILSAAALLCSALILFVQYLQVAQDLRQGGTALLPIYKWCSGKFIVQIPAVMLLAGVSLVGILVSALPPPVPSNVKDHMIVLATWQELNTAIFWTVGIVTGLVLLVLIATSFFWNRAEAKWSPLLVEATGDSFCTYCGHQVRTGRVLGGWCPICGADPQTACDPHRHQRYEASGSPIPRKKKSGTGARHLAGSKR